MRIGLIVDNLRIAQWQVQALSTLGANTEFVLLNCTNTRFSRRPIRHGLYYVLNVLSLKNQHTRSVPLPEGMPIVQRIDFEAEWEGNWQRLPAALLGMLRPPQPEVIIKFGMGLLRVPGDLEPKILSYHHGNPNRFRGRPAGFYELLQRQTSVGQVVQIISDRLDGGEIVAFAETPALAHSYRETMLNAYRTSPLLLRAAVRNCLAGTTLPLQCDGRNYRLPSNVVVMRFVAKLLLDKVKRLIRGLFLEKIWEVASVETARAAAQLVDQLDQRAEWKVIERPHGYRFLADPFPHPEGGVLVEALRRSDGQGEIVHIRCGNVRTLCRGAGHFSYPATVEWENKWFIVPEIAEWSSPRLYPLAQPDGQMAGALPVQGAPRLVDPTLHTTTDGVYLFANNLVEGSHVLRLWWAPALGSEFTEHPQSPILISPRGARMAGCVMEIGGKLFRPGQDSSHGYGHGVILFEIQALSPILYKEQEANTISFKQLRGPHTLNVSGGRAYFDFYRNSFTPLAGPRRLRARFAKRKASSLAN